MFVTHTNTENCCVGDNSWNLSPKVTQGQCRSQSTMHVTASLIIDDAVKAAWRWPGCILISQRFRQLTWPYHMMDDDRLMLRCETQSKQYWPVEDKWTYCR